LALILLAIHFPKGWIVGLTVHVYFTRWACLCCVCKCMVLLLTLFWSWFWQVTSSIGHDFAHAASCQPLTVEAGFVHGSVHVGFVVDRVALGRFLSEFFCFLLSVSFRCGSPLLYSWGWIIGLLEATVQRYSLTPLTWTIWTTSCCF
jgi:hypothetical protein